MAQFDDFIGSNDDKFHYNFWRPETAIHLADLITHALTRGPRVAAPADAPDEDRRTGPCDDRQVVLEAQHRGRATDEDLRGVGLSGGAGRAPLLVHHASALSDLPDDSGQLLAVDHVAVARQRRRLAARQWQRDVELYAGRPL